MPAPGCATRTSFGTRRSLQWLTRSRCRGSRNVPHAARRRAGRSVATLGRLLERLQRGGPDDPLLHWLPSENPEGGINHAMRRFARERTWSHRERNGALVINPRRFRFSIATYMAEEGASAFHIAEVLDHSDTQNVWSILRPCPLSSTRSRKATDAALAPLVGGFKARSLIQRTRRPSQVSRIKLFRRLLRTSGSLT